jgi:hypothetical protein
MSLPFPSYYEEISADQAFREVSCAPKKPGVASVDLLPFQELGGRRFEILAYSMLLEPPPADGAIVTLVKASGDMGRDVVVHREGVLRSVVQCKALEEPFGRPALVRELMKLAVYDKVEGLVPSSGIEYEIWAPGGFTEPAVKLMTEWPNSLREDEVKEAFSHNKWRYKKIETIEWESCSEHLLVDFPLKTKLVFRDGLRLSQEIRSRSLLFAHFFQVNVVLSFEDAMKFGRMGGRLVVEEDIQRIVQDIQAFDEDQRIVLGPTVFGLSKQHYALMSIEELRLFMEASLKPYSTTHQVLLSSLGRYVDKRATELRDSSSFSSPNFPLLLFRVLGNRMVSRMSRNFSLKTINVRPPFNDDELDLQACAERIIVKCWDEFDQITAAYDPSRDASESDPEKRARIAAHARLGAPARVAFESLMREDFARNLEAIARVDGEILSLVPERVIFLSDTRQPFDDPDVLKQVFDNFREIRQIEQENNGQPKSDQASKTRGAPQLLQVTWSPVEYREPGLFRGYRHALVLRGTNFSADAQIAHRRRGEGFPAGNSDYFWQKPRLLVANYAEIPVGGGDSESSLSWRGFEFSIRNSPAESSAWVEFEYPFDYEALHEELTTAEKKGIDYRNEGDFAHAEPKLRKAYVFADRLLGPSDDRARSLRRLREQNLDDLELSKLRFRAGDIVQVTEGEQAGKSGTVRQVHLRHKFAYEVEDMDGATFFAADEQIQERSAPGAHTFPSINF